MASEEPRSLDRIEVVDYRPEWEEAFEEETRRLESVMGTEAEQVVHIGSTAVPGLSAKPIIDIMACLRDLSPEKLIQRLEPLGYVYVKQEDEPRRYFFRKGTPRTHHLHAVEYGSETHERHVRLRDLLRENEQLREEYDPEARAGVQVPGREGSVHQGEERVHTQGSRR